MKSARGELDIVSRLDRQAAFDGAHGHDPIVDRHFMDFDFAISVEADNNLSADDPLFSMVRYPPATLDPPGVARLQAWVTTMLEGPFLGLRWRQRAGRTATHAILRVIMDIIFLQMVWPLLAASQMPEIALQSLRQLKAQGRFHHFTLAYLAEVVPEQRTWAHALMNVVQDGDTHADWL